MNPRKPGKKHNGHDASFPVKGKNNNILPKWYEETTGLFWQSRGWWPARTISWAAISKGTTFYFTTKTTLPLCKLWGNKLLECFAASSIQAIIHLLPILLQVFCKVVVQKLCLFNLMKRKILAKQDRFTKNKIL